MKIDKASKLEEEGLNLNDVEDISDFFKVRDVTGTGTGPGCPGLGPE